MSLSFVVYGSVAAAAVVLLYVVINLFKIPPSRPTTLTGFSDESEIVPLLDAELKKDLQEKELLIETLKVRSERGESELIREREEKDTLKAERDGLQDELDALKRDLDVRTNQAKAPLQESLEALKEEAVVLKKQRREAEQFKTILENKKWEAEQRLSASEDELSLSRADLENVKATLKATEKALEEERSTYNNFSSAVKEKDALIEDLAQKVSAATKDLSRLHDEKISLSEELEGANRELVAVKGSIPKRISQGRVVLQRAINTFKHEREELFQQNEEYNKQLAAANMDIARLTKDYEKARQLLDLTKKRTAQGMSEKDIATLKNEKSILEKRLQALQKDLASVTVSIPQKIKNSRADLQDELETIKVENAGLQDQVSELEGQLEFFKQESQLLRDSLRLSENMKAKLQGLVSSAEHLDDIAAKELE
ncbi:MAG: hypothetical protein ABH875_01580 [Candidatus Omnitrophota bacterium]